MFAAFFLCGGRTQLLVVRQAHELLNIGHLAVLVECGSSTFFLASCLCRLKIKEFSFYLYNEPLKVLVRTSFHFFFNLQSD